MPTTVNAPQPKRTRVCAEATTDTEHTGCSGGFCQCECHPPTPIRRSRPGRFGTAPPDVVAELARLRDERRARREAGEDE